MYYFVSDFTTVLGPPKCGYTLVGVVDSFRKEMKNEQKSVIGYSAINGWWR
jgi:hypothetical protein